MEKRDLYDKDRNFTGKTFFKGEDVPEGYYYLIVMIVMENKDGRFLIQKRSDKKGGKWANTGGHPKAGESSYEGILTEVKEEIGLDISKENVELMDTRVVKNAICDLYYVKMDIDLDKIVLQEEEVASVKLASLDEVKKMIEEGSFKKNHIEAFLTVVDLVSKR